MTRGLYRTKTKSGECFVRVEYKIMIGAKPIIEIMELTERRYRERAYRPIFDELPWNEDNDAPEAAVSALSKRGPQETQILN
jgi:hypothetical protein